MAIQMECPYCRRKQKIKNRKCGSCGEDLQKLKEAGRIEYYIKYRLHDRIQRSEKIGKSIKDAQASEGKRKAQKIENPKVLQKLPENRMTFEELTDWYTGQNSVKAKAYYPTLKINLSKFNAIFGKTIITDISSMEMKNYQADRRKEGYSESYIDQEIGAAKTVINAAYENKKVSADTVQTFKAVPKLLKKGANKRTRVLTVGEFDRLIQHVPKHTLAALAIGFYMGMRKGEIVSIQWKQVNLDTRYIYLRADQTKDNEPRSIFICDSLLEILQSLPRGGDEDYVVMYKGKPVHDLRRGVIDGCEKAGIVYGRFKEGGFVMHDLRHTLVTMMRKANVAASVRMLITGHSTIEMDNRYDAVDNDDMMEAFGAHEKFLKESRLKNGNGNGDQLVSNRDDQTVIKEPDLWKW